MQNETIPVLEGLIGVCKRGQHGYRTAAGTVQNSEFRRLFNIFSQQRAQFVAELQAEWNRLGGTGQPRDDAEFEDNTKSSDQFPASDEAGVVETCQRLELATLERYQEALDLDLPLDVQYVVKRQLMDIKDANDRIRILLRAA